MTLPKSYTIDELSELVAEYLLTLNDEDQDEMYTTDRGFASSELEPFMTWLREREARDAGASAVATLSQLT